MAKVRSSGREVVHGVPDLRVDHRQAIHLTGGRRTNGEAERDGGVLPPVRVPGVHPGQHMTQLMNHRASKLYPGLLAGVGDFDDVDPADAVLPGVEHRHAPVGAVPDSVQQLRMREPIAVLGGDRVPLGGAGDHDVADGVLVTLVGCRLLVGHRSPLRCGWWPLGGGSPCGGCRLLPPAGPQRLRGQGESRLADEEISERQRAPTSGRREPLEAGGDGLASRPPTTANAGSPPRPAPPGLIATGGGKSDGRLDRPLLACAMC